MVVATMLTSQAPPSGARNHGKMPHSPSSVSLHRSICLGCRCSPAATVPTFLYGAAHKEGRPLDSIRRDLGYFKPNSSGKQWAGGLELQNLLLKPDEGPDRVTQGQGVVVIGATRWVDNYNVPVCTGDITAVRKIARLVSARGGGLGSVQAMALVHSENSIEVACNLLEPNRVGADQVQREVEELATKEGLTVGKGYFTDFSQERTTEKYLNEAVQTEEDSKTAG